MSEDPKPRRSAFRNAVITVLLMAGFVVLVMGGTAARHAYQRDRAAENLRQLKTALDAYHDQQPAPQDELDAQDDQPRRREPPRPR